MNQQAAATPTSPSWGFIAFHLGIVSLSWSAAFIALKMMDGALKPIEVGVSRALIGAVVMGAIVGTAGAKLWPERGDLKPWLLLGAFNTLIPNIFSAVAVLYISASLASLIQTTAPLYTALIMFFMFGATMTRRRVAGLLLGFAGVGLLLGPHAIQGNIATLPGIAAMTVCALCYAISNIYAQRIRTSDAMRLAYGQQLASGIVAAAIMLMWEPFARVPVMMENWHYVLFLGVVGGAIPTFMFMRLIRRAGAVIGSMTGYLVPLMTNVGAMIVLGERIGLREIAGGIIVLAGVYFVTSVRPSSAHSA